MKLLGVRGEDMGAFKRWLRRGDGSTYSFSVGTPIAAVLLADAVRSARLNMPTGSNWQEYAATFVPLSLAILAVSWYEIRFTRRRLLETGHAGWWAVPLFLGLVCLIVCLPDAGMIRGFILIAWMVLRFQYSSSRVQKTGNSTAC